MDIDPYNPNRNLSGRPKGTPNKATTRAREALALLIDNNIDKMEVWLQEVHERDGPLAALKVMVSLLDYHIPRLARTEVTGPEGAELPSASDIRFVPVAPKADARAWFEKSDDANS